MLEYRAKANRVRYGYRGCIQVFDDGKLLKQIDMDNERVSLQEARREAEDHIHILREHDSWRAEAAQTAVA